MRLLKVRRHRRRSCGDLARVVARGGCQPQGCAGLAHPEPVLVGAQQRQAPFHIVMRRQLAGSVTTQQLQPATVDGTRLFPAAASDLYDAGSRSLLLDLSEIDTLTSAGMRAMQKVYRLFTPPEESLKIAHVNLCNAPPQVYHVLGITGFLLTIPNYENKQAALDSFTE